MTWDLIKDNMTSFVSVLFLGIPLLIGILGQIRKETVRKKRQKLKMGFFVIVCGCFLLLWLGYDKIRRDAEKDDQYANTSNKLNEEILKLSTYKRSDSIRYINDSIKDVFFQRQLLEQFKIVRDSITNKPMVVNKSANITNAGTVNIY